MVYKVFFFCGGGLRKRGEGWVWSVGCFGLHEVCMLGGGDGGMGICLGGGGWRGVRARVSCPTLLRHVGGGAGCGRGGFVVGLVVFSCITAGSRRMSLGEVVWRGYRSSALAGIGGRWILGGFTFVGCWCGGIAGFGGRVFGFFVGGGVGGGRGGVGGVMISVANAHCPEGVRQPASIQVVLPQCLLIFCDYSPTRWLYSEALSFSQFKKILEACSRFQIISRSETYSHSSLLFPSFKGFPKTTPSLCRFMR